ncbi:hypothetical protein AWJ20_4082 [Sugiyamaella lignohabitans]|uniref:Major facilitator superfamily (MFS) profile domain-containing protein n=1 Tax=Sugiyamaella lignohabitans TaxID=796027 RepID=A0A161HJ04_9ASCO|nr:uncharacterized protein AWJ20_4082 [Sugiyamaella lignohabitans]ANB11278.1 hypothetical protein AWJ20_4082 [Sugiyamaella lignohabitans]
MTRPNPDLKPLERASVVSLADGPDNVSSTDPNLISARSTPPASPLLGPSSGTPTTPTRWKRKSSRQNIAKEEEEDDLNEEPSYWTLPRRDQIFFLIICRFTEPLAYASISPYIYYMIRDFGYTDPSKISALVTLVTTSFSLGQALTAVWWGRFADRYGRKPALLLGLIGTAISVMVFGTSTSIFWAMLGRCMSGLLNGNIGVMRTMVAEFVGNKKQYQTRAFAILPITMNVGTVVGPMIGGLLADPANNYPWLFGDSEFLKKYPYILPNLFPIPFIIAGLICTFLFIEETLDSPGALLPKSQDYGLKLGLRLKAWTRRSSVQTESHGYEVVPNETLESEDEVSLSDLEEDEEFDESIAESSSSPESTSNQSINKNRPENTTEGEAPKEEPVDRSLKAILTRPVKVTLVAYIILMLHAPSFMQLLPLFLSTPRMDDGDHHTNPFIFNGGLGLKTSEIGVVISILGGVGVAIQLLIYPRLANYLGNAKLHKTALLLFPPCYFLIPYLSFVPASPEYLSMLCTVPLAALVILGRTFAVPPMTVLITNASPSRKVLGTVHGVTHSVTSIARCVGPFVLGNLYSLGVKVNMISLAWWTMAAIVVVENFVAANLEEWGQDEPLGA